jgi:hypothetical protein
MSTLSLMLRERAYSIVLVILSTIRNGQQLRNAVDSTPARCRHPAQ